MTVSCAKLAVLVPTFRDTQDIYANLSYIAACGNALIDIHIADNSESASKHEFLEKLKFIHPHIILHLHKKNIGSFNNFLFLLEQSSGYKYINFVSDDDRVSYPFLTAGIEMLDSNPNLSRSAGKLIGIQSKGAIFIENSQSLAATASERLAQSFQPTSFNVIHYAITRRTSVEPWLLYAKNHPMISSFFDALCTCSALAQGGVTQHGTGHYLYSSDNWDTADSNQKTRGKYYAEVGLPMDFSYFQDLHFALEGLLFFTGRFSPVTDNAQKIPSAQVIWDRCMSLFRAGVKCNPVVFCDLLKNDAAAISAVNELMHITDISNPKIFTWFIDILRVFNSSTSKKYASFVTFQTSNEI